MEKEKKIEKKKAIAIFMILLYSFILIFAFRFTSGNYESLCQDYSYKFNTMIDESMLTRATLCGNYSDPQFTWLRYESQDMLKERSVNFIISISRFILFLYCMGEIFDRLISIKERKVYFVIRDLCRRLFDIFAFVFIFVIIFSMRTVWRIG